MRSPTKSPTKIESHKEKRRAVGRRAAVFEVYRPPHPQLMEVPITNTYNVQASPATPRCRLAGTRHEGPDWTATVRALRKAVRKAASTASWRAETTPDSVGLPIIHHLEDLDPGSLHVLALVTAILVRGSKR